jgi:HEAT repeat protein
MNHKSFRLTLLAASCFLTLPARAQTADVDALLKEFKGESTTTVRTPEDSLRAYTRVLEFLLPNMSNPDVGKQGAAVETWQRISFHAARPGAEIERAAVAKATTFKLTPDVPTTTRLYLFKVVEYIGRDEVVPALTEALKDKEPLSREAARRALQNNPAPSAATALRTALEKTITVPAATNETTQLWQIGLINALAIRRDAADVKLLARFIKSHEVVAAAAIAALGQIGGAEAANVVSGVSVSTKLEEPVPAMSAALRNEVARAAIQAADITLRNGDRDVAENVYSYYYDATHPQQIRTAALRGLVMARGTGATPLLLEALTGSDVEMQNIAARFVSDIPGRQATAAFAALLPQLPDTSKITLLDELGTRGDVAARSAILDQIKSTKPEVRVAALAALGSAGDARDAVLLAQLASTTRGRERDAARQGLARLRDTGANSTLLKALNGSRASAALRIELIRGLASRRATVAVPTLLQIIASKEAPVQSEAIAALGVLGDEKIAPQLVNLLTKTTSDETREASARSLADIYDRRRNKGGSSAPVLAALSKAPVAARIQMIGLLRHIADANALQAARAALQSSHVDVHDAAVRSLAEWPHAAPLNDLIAIARNDKEITHQVLALRGYVRLSGSGERTAEEKVKLLQTGLGAANRIEEKRLVLSALGDVPDLAAIKAVQPFMSGETAEEASAAIVKIADALSKVSNATESVLAAVRPMLTTVVNISRSGDTTTSAAQLLATLDDQARRTWLVCGPFPIDNDERFETPFAPEQTTELQARYATSIGKKQYSPTWREIRANGNKVDFANFYEPTNGNIVEHAFVYALGYVYSPVERKVKLAMGSDDGIRAWVNDELVFSHHIHRAAKMDEDITDATLRAGWNKVLLKLENNTADWQFFFRVADEKLSPIPDLKFATQPTQ